jgi:hypothetical protein
VLGLVTSECFRAVSFRMSPSTGSICHSPIIPAFRRFRFRYVLQRDVPPSNLVGECLTLNHTVWVYDRLAEQSGSPGGLAVMPATNSASTESVQAVGRVNGHVIAIQNGYSERQGGGQHAALAARHHVKNGRIHCVHASSSLISSKYDGKTNM